MQTHYRPTLAALFAIVALIPTASPRTLFAQDTGSCQRGDAEAWLDSNNVRTDIDNMGGIALNNDYRYFVGGLSVVGPINIWFGGLVDGDLRVSGGGFWSREMWPGPLLPGASLPNSSDCSAYDRIWEITSEDIEQFEATGIVSDNLRDWPWQLGAPVLDGDGNPDNYVIHDGDRPELIGTQRFWWVMNDVGNAHLESESMPLGIEVRGSAAAASSISPSIDNATVHSFRIINRQSQPIDSLFLGVFAEAKMGTAGIAVGVDTSRAMSFVYDTQDDHRHYGGAPPAMGLVLLNRWPAASDGMDNDYDGIVDESGEEAGLGHFMSFGDEDIHTADHKYDTMNARWRGGTPLTVGEYGWNASSTPTRYFFPGDPVTRSYWSGMNVDSLGTTLDQFTRPLSVTSFGPINLGPGEEAEFAFAYVFAQGSSNLDSVVKLRQAATRVRMSWATRLGAATISPEKVEPPRDYAVSRPYPNPSAGAVSFDVTLRTEETVEIILFNLVGQKVWSHSDSYAAGTHRLVLDVGNRASGLYHYRVRIRYATSSGTLQITK